MSLTEQLRDQAVRVAGVMDPELFTGVQAARAVEDLAITANAVNGTLMFLALRVAKTDAWQGQGFASAADWLAAKAGVSVYEANRLLGTARRADRLPKTKAAMKKGDLSPDQADAVADGATADPGAEDDLLGSAANDTHAKLREEAAKRKAAATDAAERERRIRRNRSLRTGTDAEGAFWARVYGPGVDAARFEAMIRPFEEIVFRQHRTAGRRDTYENRRYDALMLMLAFYAQLADRAKQKPKPKADAPTTPSEPADPPSAPQTASSGAAGAPSRAAADPSPDEPARRADSPPQPPPEPSACSPGESPPSDPPGTWSPPWDPGEAIELPTRAPGGDNVKVIVNVDHTALLRGHTLAGETCEIAGIGPVSVQAVREILRDDPFLAVVVRKGVDIVNVAHHGRGLNAAQRTAVEADGLRCRNIACNRTVALQIDHRVPYGTDPITELDNADPLCTSCHNLKTHRGHHLEAGRGRRRLLPPGHPDNPLTPTDAAGDPNTSNPGLPTGKALVDLINTRPLTPAEEHELENRCLERLAHRGHDVSDLRMTRPPTEAPRIEQPTLC